MPQNSFAPDDPLTALAYALAQSALERQRLEVQIGERVRKARAAGVSWQRIGEALGMTKQGAQQRYGARPEQQTA